MPTPDEVRVIKMLSAIEIPPDAGATVVLWGNAAVTVVCEAALGTYPGLRMKVRTNAVSLLGLMDHPQAVETIALLLNDSNPDVSHRAMRAAGRQKSPQAVEKLAQVLSKPDSSPLSAAEAVKALVAIDSPASRARVAEYESASPSTYPHRGSAVVQEVIRRYR